MASLAKIERDQLHERIRALIADDPPVDGDQALEHGALRAPTCGCERSLPGEGGR